MIQAEGGRSGCPGRGWQAKRCIQPAWSGFGREGVDATVRGDTEMRLLYNDLSDQGGQSRFDQHLFIVVDMIQIQRTIDKG